MKSLNNGESYTGEEIVSNFITDLYSKEEILDRQQKRDGIAIAVSVLSTIEECTPIFELISSSDGTNIAGELNQMISADTDRLNGLKSNGFITAVELDFINAVRRMAYGYDIDGMTDSHQLVSKILGLIDNGVNGITFEMKAFSCEEDISYYQDRGVKYYPLEGENIAGNLSNLYTTMANKTKEPEEVTSKVK